MGLGDHEKTFLNLSLKTVTAVWSLQQTGFDSIFFTLQTLIELFCESGQFEMPAAENSQESGMKLYVDIIALMFSSTQMLLYANLPDSFFYINLLMPILYSIFSDKGEGAVLYLSIFVPLVMIIFAATKFKEALLESILLVNMYLLLITKVYEKFVSDESAKSTLSTAMHTTIMYAVGRIAIKSCENKNW